MIFSSRRSAKYLELKSNFLSDFGKNLDDYDMYSQVQLIYNNAGDYFVADQIFVKYKTIEGQKMVDDMVVIEDKLGSSTRLTTPQNGALKSSSYRVRSISESSRFGSNDNLTQGMNLKFDKDIQWYKVSDGIDGKTIQNIINIK